MRAWVAKKEQIFCAAVAGQEKSACVGTKGDGQAIWKRRRRGQRGTQFK